jgi:type II secretory pathway pseudopilin PulG
VKNRQCHPRAFSLIEVTLALGVAAFCLVVVFGLLPLGITSNQNSIQQSAAASMSRAIVADLHTAPPASSLVTTSTSAIFGIPIPAAGAGTSIRDTLYLRQDGTTGGAPINQDANGAFNPLYRATLYFYPPPVGGQRTATFARLLITWPALADSKAGVDPINFTGSYEVDISLDRN